MTPDSPTQPPAERSGPLSRTQESSAPDLPGSDAPDGVAGSGSSTPSRDRMAVAGFVSSLCVPLITLLLVTLGSVPSTSETAGGVFLLLLLAGAVLWITGLVLSLMAKDRAPRHHKLAKAGTIISAISPMLFIALFILLLIMTLDWYLSDFFTIGVPTNDISPDI